MKEQILHLDPHDDYVSARDKMGWVQTQRVLLVWPQRAPSNGTPPLQRRLDLVLLHRHAHRLGAQLALVTRDEAVRDNAAELGLPVFESVEATRTMRWRARVPRIRPTRRNRRPDTAPIREWMRTERTPTLRSLPNGVVFGLRLIVFLIGLLALFGLLYTLVPSASIALTLAPQPIATTVEVIADPAISTLQASVIPARRVRVEVQNTQLLPTTGSVEVPGERAAGTVIFNNIAGTAALIPQGTSVRTGNTNARFTTQQAVNIEGRIGATVQVEIQAVDKGLTGNVPANAINTIDGPLGTQLAVVNAQPTTGGNVERRAAVTAADREALQTKTLTQLQQSSLAAIEAQLQPGEFVVSETVTVTQVLAEDFDPALGEASDTISLTLRIAATGTAVSEAQVRAVAVTALEASLPSGAALVADTVRVTRSPAFSVDEAGRIRFTVNAEASALPAIDRERVRAAVSGLSLTEAATRLQSTLPLAAPPEIVLRPAWLAQWYAVLPWLPLRIDLTVR
ncbi:MAG: baseplate J/gp47 family protein [Anaerolineales bacterium]